MSPGCRPQAGLLSAVLSDRLRSQRLSEHTPVSGVYNFPSYVGWHGVLASMQRDCQAHLWPVNAGDAMHAQHVRKGSSSDQACGPDQARLLVFSSQADVRPLTHKHPAGWLFASRLPILRSIATPFVSGFCVTRRSARVLRSARKRGCCYMDTFRGSPKRRSRQAFDLRGNIPSPPGGLEGRR